MLWRDRGGEVMFLGLDIGTSSVKAVLMGDDGAVTMHASALLTVQRPHPRWSEQAPDDWWTASGAAVGALPAELRARVAGIGLSGQMHGLVALGVDDRPLCPAMLWNDGRADAECAKLEAAVPGSRAITGTIAMAGFTAPKLMWLARHEPGVRERVACVMLPKDYVRLRMTGVRATDMSDAAGTLWFDVAARGWSAPMLAACGLAARHMPALHEGLTPAGQLRAEVAAAWGMARVPVAAGAGDNAAAAVGMSAVEPGRGYLALGTSGVLYVATDAHRPAPETATHALAHTVPGRWQTTAVILSAAAALDWVARACRFDTVENALAAAETCTVRDEIFLPYLSGERTPHNDPAATGVLFGLTHDTTPGAIVRAVLEGVAFAFADGLAAIRAGGGNAARLTLVGGAARSDLWARILAAALGVPLVRRAGSEHASAIGAARLGMMAATGASVADACPEPAILAEIEPDPALAAALAARYARYRRLYPALRPEFPR